MSEKEQRLALLCAIAKINLVALQMQCPLDLVARSTFAARNAWELVTGEQL